MIFRSLKFFAGHVDRRDVSAPIPKAKSYARLRQKLDGMANSGVIRTSVVSLELISNSPNVIDRLSGSFIFLGDPLTKPEAAPRKTLN